MVKEERCFGSKRPSRVHEGSSCWKEQKRFVFPSWGALQFTNLWFLGTSLCLYCLVVDDDFCCLLLPLCEWCGCFWWNNIIPSPGCRRLCGLLQVGSSSCDVTLTKMRTTWNANKKTKSISYLEILIIIFKEIFCLVDIKFTPVTNELKIQWYTTLHSLMDATLS